MFIEDLRTDFYDVLLGNRVLLLVHYDVDAICTCKILQELFKSDNISYTLVPVGSIDELKTAYEENNEEIKYVVLVNFGGTIDLVDILQPEEDVVFFVLDSHKPTDICNVYSDGQVRLVYKDSEENIPNFDDIFRDDEDEDEQPTESGMEALEAVVEKRRERRAWEERRHTLMFNYTQFSYFGKPSACVALELSWRVSRRGGACLWASACVALELSWRVSRCGGACVWAAAVAAAAHAALHARAPARCLLDADDLHRRIATSQHDDRDQTSCRVVLEKEPWLPLYRRWSLEAALSHAPLLGPALASDQRLRALLADMGYPLSQARQAFCSMDVELRRGLVAALGAAAAARGLPDPTRAAFLLRRPHRPPLPALDLVYVIMALIEHETLPPAEGFQLALSALDVTDTSSALALGAAAAQRALGAVRRLVAATLSSRRLQCAGPFNYFIVQEGTPEAALVRGPLWLGEAARWALRAGPRPPRPLLAAAPLPDSRCLLLGLPPRFDHEPRNLFGAAFEQAAGMSGATAAPLRAHAAVALPAAQRAQFLDALTALLA